MARHRLRAHAPKPRVRGAVESGPITSVRARSGEVRVRRRLGRPARPSPSPPGSRPSSLPQWRSAADPAASDPESAANWHSGPALTLRTSGSRARAVLASTRYDRLAHDSPPWCRGRCAVPLAAPLVHRRLGGSRSGWRRRAVAGKPTSDDLTIPGSDSTRATDLLDERSSRAEPTARSRSRCRRHGPARPGRQQDGGQGDRQGATGRTPRVRSVTSPFSEEGSEQLTKDGTIGYISLNLRDGPAELDEEEADSLIARRRPGDARRDRRRRRAPTSARRSRSRRPSRARLIGLAVAVVVLAFAFGTLVAMPLPIVTAIFGLAAGLSLVGLLGHLIDVPSIAATLGTMLGLGVGIDYALFIVTRYRGFLAEGHDVEESVARATATSGGAVLFAGSTVVIALLSLYFGGIPIVRALGYSAASSSPSRSSRRSRCCRRSSARWASGSTACGCRSASTPTTTNRTAGRAGRARSASDRSPAAIVGLLILVAPGGPAARHHASGSPTTASSPRTPRRGSPTTSSPRASAPGPTGRCSSRSGSTRRRSRTRRS